MKADLSARVFAWAWRVLPRVNETFASMIADVAADVTWLLHGRGVRQLEANLARIVEGLDARELRRLSRRGMRSYFRYFREAFQIRSLTKEQVAARVRAVGAGPLQELLAEGQALVLALGHLGNWDLAGQWSAQNFAAVTTVAERLNPPELFDEFVAFRTALGMKILAFGDDGIFREMQDDARGPARIIPLLADRDLGKSGVEVTINGHVARVAAGPAALAVSTGAPLFTLVITYERLHGARRRQARSKWGLVLNFSDQIEVSDLSGPTRVKVQQATQRWVDELVAGIRQYPQDWHMLQKVFVADLDPVKYQQVTGDKSR
ncbi:KDO2-lipid IV(A) lauroyltransferase [Micrococcales bacterium KH10]|nr:KDO2-lipid IV(A) lauroyltransferase [Micrococcales bacterium KH10]